MRFSWSRKQQTIPSDPKGRVSDRPKPYPGPFNVLYQRVPTPAHLEVYEKEPFPMDSDFELMSAVAKIEAILSYWAYGCSELDDYTAGRLFGARASIERTQQKLKEERR